MASLSDFFGEGSIGEQLLIWGALNQLIGAALNPAIVDITQSVNSADAVVALSPEQLAVGTLRGLFDPGNSEAEAAKSGIGSGRFQELMLLAGSPPSLDLLIAAQQRTLGDAGGAPAVLVDMEKALADLGIASNYRGIIDSLVIQIPTAQQVLNAWLEGQITEDEAVGRIKATGMDPTWIQTAYNSEGQAPTPVEALEMLNRGLIPRDGTGPESTSYLQAFLEGPWRNKWEAAFEGLRYYVPPPRTVTALLKEGAITEAQATQYLQAAGLDADLTAIYIAAASHSTTAAQRELTQAQIIDAYESGLLTEAEAHADLVAARFTASDATLLLALADKKAAVAATKQATTRLRDLYLAGTNDAATTTRALSTLGLTDASVSTLLATWNLERTTATKSLTASEWASALFYGIIDQPTAQAGLENLGFTPHDAWIVLSVRMHGPQPNEPGA